MDTMGEAVAIGQRALWVALLVSSPLLIAGLVVGVLISTFQAVTQIHEMTLTFIPKIVAVVGTLLFFLPWMLDRVVVFSESIFRGLASVGG